MQATIAEAASHAHLSVSWTPPVEGNELAEQFHEMETWIGRITEAGDMVRQELKSLQVCALQVHFLPLTRSTLATTCRFRLLHFRIGELRISAEQ
jgi:hypothetical protein